MRFWEHFNQIGLRSDQDVAGLILNSNDASDSILNRRELTVYINVHVERAGVDHWIPLINGEVLNEKELSLDCSLKQPHINRGTRSESSDIEFSQPVVETF